VKGEGDTVIFRGKMYFQSETSLGFSAWKQFPQYFKRIIQEKPLELDIERQISCKRKARDKNVSTLKIGRWFKICEHWDNRKLIQIFRADCRRHRDIYDSYELFLEGILSCFNVFYEDLLFILLIQNRLASYWEKVSNGENQAIIRSNIVDSWHHIPVNYV
jgi:hypothetical protein